MCKERIKCRKKDVLGNLDMKLEELIQMPNNLDEKTTPSSSHQNTRLDSHTRHHRLVALAPEQGHMEGLVVQEATISPPVVEVLKEDGPSTSGARTPWSIYQNSILTKMLEVWFTNSNRVGTTNYLVAALDDETLLHEKAIDDAELDKLFTACKDWGFFQVVNHGVSSQLREKLKLEIEKFFKLPIEEKKKYQIRAGDVQGYGTGYLEVILQRIDETRYGTSGVIRKSHKRGDEGSDGDFL
ncbi:hypothetical protein JHK82_027165 [Glycine max]|nr:hypothetical protein JHK82_027165 [Glycine max]